MAINTKTGENIPGRISNEVLTLPPQPPTTGLTKLRLAIPTTCDGRLHKEIYHGLKRHLLVIMLREEGACGAEKKQGRAMGRRQEDQAHDAVSLGGWLPTYCTVCRMLHCHHSEAQQQSRAHETECSDYRQPTPANSIRGSCHVFLYFSNDATRYNTNRCVDAR